MSFTENLSKVVHRVEGCAAATILGIDGIPIERYLNDLDPAFDMELAAIELTNLLKRSMQVAADAELGLLQELIFSSDQMIFLLRPITTDYFILLLMYPDGNIGRARFELRKAQFDLEREFAL